MHDPRGLDLDLQNYSRTFVRTLQDPTMNLYWVHLLTHIKCVAAHFQFQSSILTHGRLSQSFSIWLIHGDVMSLNLM